MLVLSGYCFLSPQFRIQTPKKGADHFREGLPTSLSLTRIIPCRHGHRLMKSVLFSGVCLWACILSDSGTCTVDSAGCCTGVYSQVPLRHRVHCQELQAASGTVSIILMTLITRCP